MGCKKREIVAFSVPNSLFQDFSRQKFYLNFRSPHRNTGRKQGFTSGPPLALRFAEFKIRNVPRLQALFAKIQHFRREVRIAFGDFQRFESAQMRIDSIRHICFHIQAYIFYLQSRRTLRNFCRFRSRIVSKTVKKVPGQSGTDLDRKSVV